MNRWNSTQDMLSDCETVLAKVLDGELDPRAASAAIGALKIGVRVLDVNLQHARLAGRIQKGDRHIPSIRLVQKREPLAAE